MNINPLIEAAFADFTVAGRHIPIAFLNYTGTEKTYLTYYTWLEKPDNFYDDGHHAEVAFGTINIFSKGNFKEVLNQIKIKLKQNKFTWMDNGSETFDQETGYYHVPVNFYYTGNAENN